MDTKTYTITLADGTEIENLSKNGDNFISKSELTTDMFEDNLSTVTIDDGDNVETMTNAELIHLTEQSNGKYWFALRELTDAELKELQFRADLSYLAMMTGVDL